MRASSSALRSCIAVSDSLSCCTWLISPALKRLSMRSLEISISIFSDASSNPMSLFSSVTSKSPSLTVSPSETWICFANPSALARMMDHSSNSITIGAVITVGLGQKPRKPPTRSSVKAIAPANQSRFGRSVSVPLRVKLISLKSGNPTQRKHAIKAIIKPNPSIRPEAANDIPIAIEKNQSIARTP